MTRTFKHLYPQVYDPENLWVAWRAARRGGKRKWPSVASFEVDLEMENSRSDPSRALASAPGRPKKLGPA